ncbi:hypothetical protein CQW23_10024 [Capsicum baccatum]|uniref:Endonuclease/exonuclease/phosphatase domain-containing protein n=1 Tax=Capsicum baccatum TaxID=33114 RepID=A0A2G2WYF7_CAPBA|nr:hypothetical protein CQW23_10024 [Capsicum baccatum]
MARRQTATRLPVQAPQEPQGKTITPDTGIPHTLAPMKQSRYNGEDVTKANSILEGEVLQEENEAECSNAARKLQFSAMLQATPPMEEDLKQTKSTPAGNLQVQEGMKLTYIPLMVKDGRKIVKINHTEVEEECGKWENAIIGCVVEEHQADKNGILQNGSYTYNNRPMVLWNWAKDFRFKDEMLCFMPLWVVLPGLPIYYWAEDNLSRIASYIRKPICADRLTKEVERISYAQMLIKVDITQELLEQIYIEKHDSTIHTQAIEFEWAPELCQDCMHMCHTTGKCREVTKEEELPKVVTRPKARRRKINPTWLPKAMNKDQGQKDLSKQTQENKGKEGQQPNGKEIMVDRAGSFPTLQQAYQKSPKSIGSVMQHLTSQRKEKGQPSVPTDRAKAPDLTGENGRIWVCCKQGSVDVTILETSAQMVHCAVQDKNSTFTCWMTFVYGFNTLAARRTLWDHLRHIRANCQNPWVVLGDFNANLSYDDSINGEPVTPQELVDFQQCIDDVGIGPLPSKGHRYTWCNKRDHQASIYSRIDWALGNHLWFIHYNRVKAEYKDFGLSDHTPIILSTDLSVMQVRRPFRLLNVVMQQEDFKALTRAIWQQKVPGYKMYSVWRKLYNIAGQTKGLQKEMSVVDKRVDEYKTVQKGLKSDLFNQELIGEERQILHNIEYWETINERILKQKSRAFWIKQGDRNSK